jgi:hypothetical protein
VIRLWRVLEWSSLATYRGIDTLNICTCWSYRRAIRWVTRFGAVWPRNATLCPRMAATLASGLQSVAYPMNHGGVYRYLLSTCL